MSIPETLAYAREVGEAGGTLTLEYDDGLVTLTGPGLLEAVEDAEDQDTTEVFTVVGTEER